MSGGRKLGRRSSLGGTHIGAHHKPDVNPFGQEYEHRFEHKLFSVSQHLEEYQSQEGHSRCVYSTAFSPDGLLILTGSADKTVKLWSFHTRVSRHRSQASPRRPCVIVWHIVR